MTLKSIKYDMTETKKFELISQFHEWYYNTDQDAEEFGKEFFYVVSDIVNGQIPVKLEYLEDYQEELVELFFPELEEEILKRSERNE